MAEIAGALGMMIQLSEMALQIDTTFFACLEM